MDYRRWETFMKALPIFKRIIKEIIFIPTLLEQHSSRFGLRKRRKI